MKKISFFIVLLILFFFSSMVVSLLPKFSEQYSFVVYDKNNQVLNAQVSLDEQWRFPEVEKLSQTYKECAILYEDKYFYFHNGIDFFSLLRAIYLNIKHSRVISGASTLTMQVSRIAENNKPRTILQKVKEMVLSVVLEVFYDKEKIINLYANNAPFGGNIVGISAASHRYFLRSQSNLSIAEIATLAVLPNEPGLVRPGLNEDRLLSRRNNLLQKLKVNGLISSNTYDLSLAENSPTVPKDLPNITPHYANFLKTTTGSHFAKVDIDTKLQERVTEIVESFSLEASRSKVYNACALILENSSGAVLAYIGNTGIHEKKRVIEAESVDIIQSRRSSGSLLKPFLYAASLDASLILPTSLLKDMPTQFGAYIPENNTHSFLGAVSADEALTKSLNVPFVNLLTEYTVEHFLLLLKRLGFSTFKKDAEHYGLPLILGGGEVTLFEIANVYRNFTQAALGKNTHFPISQAACRITLDMLLKGVRPKDEESYRYYSTAKQIAWKTGTSYGNKDAWSVGVTPEYTVAVWLGNANGTGRPEITSSNLSSPLMFRLFELLPSSTWPEVSRLEYNNVLVCKHSGFIASQYCDECTEILIPSHTHSDKVCAFCKPVSLTKDEKFQVSDVSLIEGFPIIKNFFVLPRGQEYYYSQSHPEYQKLPPKYGAINTNIDFDIIFPEENTSIYIPITLDGSSSAFVAKVAYLDDDKELFWFLDDTFLTITKNLHEVEIITHYGKHVLTVVDSYGNELSRHFFVLND